MGIKLDNKSAATEQPQSVDGSGYLRSLASALVTSVSLFAASEADAQPKRTLQFQADTSRGLNVEVWYPGMVSKQQRAATAHAPLRLESIRNQSLDDPRVIVMGAMELMSKTTDNALRARLQNELAPLFTAPRTPGGQVEIDQSKVASVAFKLRSTVVQYATQQNRPEPRATQATTENTQQENEQLKAKKESARRAIQSAAVSQVVYITSAIDKLSDDLKKEHKADLDIIRQGLVVATFDKRPEVKRVILSTGLDIIHADSGPFVVLPADPTVDSSKIAQAAEKISAVLKKLQK